MKTDQIESGGRHIPSSTYRFQFCGDFRFCDAAALLEYLDEAGFGALYASPVFQARAGSSHGYDVCDHNRLSPDIGTEQEFAALSGALRARGMGLLFDMIPNHMGIADSGNAWWMDVIENGPASRFASYFDIDWRPFKPELEDKLLLPILEDQYGNVLESGKLRLHYQDGAFLIRYYEMSLPLAPRSYRMILDHCLRELTRRLGSEDEDIQELRSIVTALTYLPPREQLSPDKAEERTREKEITKRRISALCLRSAPVRAALERSIEAFNGEPGRPQSFDLLDVLMDDQPYRLAFWRVATEEINYRRFFEVNDLAAIRVELPEVFQATHRMVFRLLAEDKITGLRIDHPDGLWDPSGYFRLLQREYRRLRLDPETAFGLPGGEGQSGGKDLDKGLPLYVVVEKILSEGEPLPEDWAVHGTTGYDFLNLVNGLFVDSSQRRSFDRIYGQFTGRTTPFADLANSCKKMIMLVSMAGEINALAHVLDQISEKNRRYRDFTHNSLTFALREVIAALPVYRTYIRPSAPPAEGDREYIEWAVAEARKRNPRAPRAIFDFILDTLLLRNTMDFEEPDRPRLLDFVMKFQQITGPVMAKGVEDTVFYVYNRLVSLNEVGGHPGRFGVSLSEFHAANLERLRRWPGSLLATSTHDTKRSEDVRARINALSEIPGEWKAALTRWRRLNAGKRTRIDGEPAPDRNDEYLVYQTLLGAWPVEDPAGGGMAEFRRRIQAYMLKAAREAKVRTSWINPNEDYERVLTRFVALLLEDTGDNRFLEDFRAMQRRVAFFGRINSLAQVLLKIASPGIPDFYQGTELWDLSLVDPDNRRPVDYRLRREVLAGLKSRMEKAPEPSSLIRDLLETAADGRVKFYLTHRLLGFRRAHRALFRRGDYVPLSAAGEWKENVCAFARVLSGDVVLAAAPRLVARLTRGVERWPLGEEIWGDTLLTIPAEIAGAGFRNVLSGETVRPELEGDACTLRLSSVFQSFPVVLLSRL
ncbi:MAG: malto-oligosyltrehalose synthase [Acidobacteriota bacterium]